jgi:transforming growth factor-beta-induced protein
MLLIFRKTMKQLRVSALRQGSPLLTVIFLLATLTACKRKNDQPPVPLSVPPGQSIVQLAQNDPNLSTFVTALSKAELITTLGTTGAGPYTVFAPTNTAFTASGIDVKALTKEQLRPVLLYHVSAGKKLATNLLPGAIVTAQEIAPKNIYISKGSAVSVNGGTAQNGAKVTAADLVAKNGVMHTIDRVLAPPTQNLLQLVQGNPDLSLLAAAITRAGTVSPKLIDGVSPPFGTASTILAPGNAAFQAAGYPDIAKINATDPKVLADLLLYHILPGFVFSTDLVNGQVGTASDTSRKITVTVSGTSPAVQGTGNTQPANLTSPNRLALDGIVHIIDQVLIPPVPPASIVNQIINNVNLDILEAAVVKAGLVTTLNGNDLTLFAPVDDKFLATLRAIYNDPALTEAQAITTINGLTTTSTPLNLSQLTSILSYHVVGTVLKVADIPFFTNYPIPTLLGAAPGTTAGFPAYTLKSVADVSINGVKVVTRDIPALNGVIHLVDRVILSPLGSGQAGDVIGFLTTAFSAANYNILVAAVTKTDLTNTLRGVVPLTLLAPTDEAFLTWLRTTYNNPALTEAQAITTVNGLTTTSTPLNLTTLKNILLYHALQQRYFSTLFQDQQVPTLLPIPGSTSYQAVTVKPTLTGPAVLGNKNSGILSNVIVTSPVAYDITVTNGLIHTIDRVLLPQ